MYLVFVDKNQLGLIAITFGIIFIQFVLTCTKTCINLKNASYQNVTKVTDAYNLQT